jgi:tetratricopeptide (TPR) repeat protein
MFSWPPSSIGKNVLKNLTAFVIAFLVWPALLAGQTMERDRLQSILAEARHAQGMNDLFSAVTFYKEATELRPDIAELWANLGVVQYQSGAPGKAVESLLKAHGLNPSLFVPDLFLGLSYLRLEQAEHAIPYLTKALDLNSSDPQVHLALGRAYSLQGSLFASATAYGKAVQLDPRNSSAWFEMGIEYLELVERDSRTLSEVAPTSSFGQALLAESLVGRRRFLEAEDLYKVAISAPVKPPCLHTALGLLYLRVENADAARNEFLVDGHADATCGLSDLGLSGLAIETGLYDDALGRLQAIWNRDRGLLAAHFDDVVEALPIDRVVAFEGFLSARHRVGAIDDGLFDALSAREPRLSQDLFTPSSNSSLPASNELAIQAAKQLYTARHYGACAQRLMGSVEAGSQREMALASECSFLSGRYSVVSRVSTLWLSKMGTDPSALYWSIQANEKLAVDAFIRFERIDPGSSRTHILLGDLNRRRQRYDQAEAEYGKALELAPGDFAALVGMAWAYRYDSKLEAAKSYCELALAQKPGDPELNLLMGEVMVSLSEYEGSELYLHKGLNAKPQMRPHAHALLGKVYAETGRITEAIAEMQVGLEGDEDGSLHYQLAVLYRKTGDMTSFAQMVKQSKALSLARRKRAEIAVQGLSATPEADDGP